VWFIPDIRERSEIPLSYRLRTVALVALILSIGSAAPAVVLYDGAAGTAPESQGWLAYQQLGGSPSHVTANGKTTLDTTSAMGIQAGYSNYNIVVPVNPNFPSLSRTDGFVVSVDMKLLSETHASNDRSGVSLIVLSNDLQGVELAFWNNEVWVQSGSDFHHAEGAAFNTAVATTRYDVAIHGTGYQVFADGNPILSGNVRNYSAFGLPYTLPNFVFLGDDTTSAQGSFEFSRLAVVPEPAACVGVGVVAIGLRRRKRR
jgi:hypothetical protein